MSRHQSGLFEPGLVRQALLDAVKKLSPRVQWRNPVMFIVWLGSILTTLLAVAMAAGRLPGSAGFRSAGGRPQQGPGQQPEGHQKNGLCPQAARAAPRRRRRPRSQ